MGFHKSSKSSRESASNRFQPTTVKELKAIVRRAREKEQNKKHRVDSLTKDTPSELEKKIKRLQQNLKIKGVRARKFLRYYSKFLGENKEAYLANKKNDPRWSWSMGIPRYRIFEKERRAVSQFAFDIQMSFSSMSWKQLTKLVRIAVRGKYTPIDHIEAFWLCLGLMHQVLGISEDNSVYRIADLDRMLELWPAKPLEKEHMAFKSEKASKRSKREERDEEDEIPAKRKKGKKPKKDKGGKEASKKSTSSVKGSTVVKVLKKRTKGGPKTDLMALIPNKGISVDALISKAEKSGFNENQLERARGYVSHLLNDGWLEEA